MAAALDTRRAYVDQPRGWIFLWPHWRRKAISPPRLPGQSPGSTTSPLAYISEPELLGTCARVGGKATSEDAALVAPGGRPPLSSTTLHRAPGQDSTWADSKLVALTMPRYQHERLTIITSNVSLDDIDEPRLRSRIKGRTSEDYAGATSGSSSGTPTSGKGGSDDWRHPPGRGVAPRSPSARLRPAPAQQARAARHAAIWILRQVDETLSEQEIAQLVGLRDHTSVIYALRKVDDIVASDAAYAEALRGIIARHTGQGSLAAPWPPAAPTDGPSPTHASLACPRQERVRRLR